jgi:transposase
MKVTTLGIDLAKNIFRIHWVDGGGAVVLRRQLSRRQMLPFLARLEPCLVGMEACAGAHYWAREIQKLGHIARLTSPHFVTAYRKNQKNDGNDAEAICEAVGRPSMRFVPIKSASQQDVQAVHRIRFQLIKWRTALANKVRGLLGEYGIVVAQGLAPLRRELPLLLDDEENQLSGFFREMLGEMAERLKLLDQRIRQYDSKVEHVFGQDERCPRLAQVEGVGPLVATALVAAVGNASRGPAKSGVSPIRYTALGCGIPAQSAHQERGSPFGYHNGGEMGVGTWNYWNDGGVDDGEAIDTDEPAARIDDRRRIVRRAHPARSTGVHVVGHRCLEPRVQRGLVH